MKTQYKRRVCKFELKLSSYSSSYYERIRQLEKILTRKPKVLHLEMIGDGGIPADMALLIRSILLDRSPKTQLVTNARSSLQDGSVLVWLLGDQRLIRDDARVFFKRNSLADEDPVEVYAGVGDAEPKYKDSFTDVDPEDADYARVLQLINEFLPANEFAGKVINVPVLREFGLVENEVVDNFLAAVFSKSRREKVFT